MAVITTGKANRPPTDDPELLRVMLSDARVQPAAYQPGPYWLKKARRIAKQVKRHGLADFRGASSTIGLSYTDVVWVDVRQSWMGGIRRPVEWLFESVFPFNRVLDAQVALTKSHEAATRRMKNIVLRTSPVARDLLTKYTMPPSLAGGCLDSVEIDGARISTHYLSLLQQHDWLASILDFHRARSLFEIGGGFGVNVHLLVENYPQLRKIVYLDIPPNLYVGTQYLKSIYEDRVQDYRATRGMDRVRFAAPASDQLEILAIAPWQIEKLALEVDIFYNAHSFVEMPPFVVSNYAKHVAGLPGFRSTSVALISYGGFDSASTFDPDTLPNFFPTKTFQRSTFSTLDETSTVIAFIDATGREAL